MRCATLGDGPVDDGFERLGQLAAERDAAFARAELVEVGQGPRDAVWSFEEHRRFAAAEQLRQRLPARSAPRGQEALEVEAPGRQRRCREGGSEGAGSGNGGHRHARAVRFTNEFESGIGHQGRAGIGHEGDIAAARESRQHATRGGGLVVVVEADEFGGARAEVAQQDAATSGIFAGQYLHGLQDFGGSRRDVLQVSNGRGYHVQVSRVPQRCHFEPCLHQAEPGA